MLAVYTVCQSSGFGRSRNRRNAPSTIRWGGPPFRPLSAKGGAAKREFSRQLGYNSASMPWGLQRFQHAKQLHYITFTCYHRALRLAAPAARDLFEQTLERVRRWYGFCIGGYVVMPEHVHLLMSEPERGQVSVAIQMLKQIVSRRLGTGTAEPFWQRRYYDFNVWSEAKFVEKLRYMHRNPVKRGLVEKPDDWVWSSFRHYAAGVEITVEIESQWTARIRERLGISPQLRKHEEN